ncbi:MAPEG family protein [Curvibacter sp. HBC28]|uniref:MAPEG family protein n=1 Tax=Curvibacter microcysteis TaxID=3026419 RepID=A0ABT5ML56_9BURK|nr:MAPEG family protein [Curvibacter sp. HBC28]MDD0817116.1 MAPEG family protein [Curvibacter sp. HBC28]
MTAWPLTTLITLLMVLLLLGTGMLVARARGRHGIEAPAVTGHPLFERAYRIQMNTLENTVLTLPLLWLAAGWGQDRWAALAGAVWLLGRLWYVKAYLDNPARRGPAFGLALLASAALGLQAAWGVLHTLLG